MLRGIPNPLLTIRRLYSQIASCYPDLERVAELRANKQRYLSDELSCRQALKKHPGHDLTNHVEKQSSNEKKNSWRYNAGRHIREACMDDLPDSDLSNEHNHSVFSHWTRHALQSVTLAKWQFIKIHGKVKKKKKKGIGLSARILSTPMNVIKKLKNVFKYHLWEILSPTCDWKDRRHCQNYLSLKEKQP